MRIMKKSSKIITLKSFARQQDGFSAVELAVVAAVIVMLTILLYPRFASFVADARQSELRQDARSIQAAIELMKIEGRYDIQDTWVTDTIQEYVGRRLHGQISSLNRDGGFVYTNDVEGYRYQIAYEAQRREFIELERRVLSSSG